MGTFYNLHLPDLACLGENEKRQTKSEKRKAIREKREGKREKRKHVKCEKSWMEIRLPGGQHAVHSLGFNYTTCKKGDSLLAFKLLT